MRDSLKLRASRAKGICLQGLVNEGMIIIQKENSIVHRPCLGNGCGGRWLHPVDSPVHRDLPVRLGRCALPRDMPCLTALVAHFAGRVQGSAVRSCAVARNMALYALNPTPQNIFRSRTYQLAACIAFHGLCLTVTSVVVRSTTLVACCRARTTSSSRKAPAKTAGKSSTGRNSSPTCNKCRSGLKACIWARSLSFTVSENDRTRDAGRITAR